MYGGSVDFLYCHPNYPVYSGSSGSAIDVFDACLINGFGEVTLSSLTIDANGIATATSNAHGYNKVPLVILISGADQEAINGEWEITGTSTNTILFDATDSGLTSTTITGTTIKLKVAPLGWEKVYSDPPNYIAVYRSKDPLSRQHFLRVDDSDAYGVQTYPATYYRGFEQMSSAQDTGLGSYPHLALATRGIFSIKYITTFGVYETSNLSNISWTLVGTSCNFYFNSQYGYGERSGCRMTAFFGDMTSYIPGDYGASLLCGGYVLNSGTNLTHWVSTNSYEGRFNSRTINKIQNFSGVSLRNKIFSPTGTADGIMGGAVAAPFLEPDVYCNKMIICKPVLIADELYPNNLRGEQPGMALPLNRLTSLSNRYETNTIFTINNERYIYLGAFIYPSTYRCIFTLD